MDTSPDSSENGRKRVCGFSLVEVVLALGVFAFVIVALVGLLSVGVESNRESVAMVEATNLVQSYFAMRGSAPLTSDNALCPLPRLDQEAHETPARPVYIREDGSVATDPRDARFALAYRISPPDSTRKFSIVHVSLFWPPHVKYSQAAGFYESTKSFLLP